MTLSRLCVCSPALCFCPSLPQSLPQLLYFEEEKVTMTGSGVHPCLSPQERNDKLDLSSNTLLSRRLLFHRLPVPWVQTEGFVFQMMLKS